MFQARQGQNSPEAVVAGVKGYACLRHHASELLLEEKLPAVSHESVVVVGVVTDGEDRVAPIKGSGDHLDRSERVRQIPV